MPRWQTHPPPSSRLWPPDLSHWLFDAGSLTQRLLQRCPGQFRVQVLRQGWTRPDHDEAAALGLRRDAWAWTREVRLCCDEQPWVFARTVIPARTLRGRGRRLTRLGTRPLGAALFTDPGIRRGPLEVARIAAGQSLHQRAVAGCADPSAARWGRRSLFWLDGSPLLVCEIFLSNLPASPACC
ncbi:MAG: chorismate lyase [Candidatus Competibacteraceae bacterium]|nr:MAG: chorismate lyase [Candidatus Competibacteraceae bacterium]